VYSRVFYGYKEISVENVEQLYPGYYIDATSSTLSGRIKGDGSLVLSVYYRRNSYSLQFHLEGGSLPAEYRELKGKYEETITIPKETPKKERCEFLGWIAVVHKYTSRQEKRIIYQIMIRFCMRYGNRIVIRLSICWTIIPMKLL